jgi:hypothetical protein
MLNNVNVIGFKEVSEVSGILATSTAAAMTVLEACR